MREQTRAGCQHRWMGWEQMPVEDDAWAPAEGYWDVVPDWSDTAETIPEPPR